MDSAHPETVILPDICVMRKSLSSEYQPYAPQGHFFQGASGKIFRTALISTKIPCFLTNTDSILRLGRNIQTFTWPFG